MAPKKKGNKKGQDDWEADLGETIAPADQPENGNGAAGENDAEDEEDGGGLMAMLRKNKQKRKEKGLPEVEAAETPEQDAAAVVAKVAEEANADDEFALPDKKGKGGKGKQAPKKAAAAADDDDEGNDTGRVLTKAEKEKLKKEREKQRKKEQVR